MKKYLLMFLGMSLALACVFFLMRIQIFDGEIVLVKGVSDITVPMKLSLSYFIGIGFESGDLDGVKDFYLVRTGYFNAVLIILALPALLSYRLYLSKKNKDLKKQNDEQK